MNRTGVLCLALVLAGSSFVYAQDAVSRGIADVYAREAALLSADLPEDIDAVEDLVARALEFDSSHPDALHLTAVLGRLRDEPRARGIEALEQALSVSGFRHTSERDAILLLGRMMLETGRPARTIDVVEPLYEANNPDSEVIAQLAQAFFDLGDIRSGQEFAEFGRQVFADDPRFVSLLVLHDNAPSAMRLDELSYHEGHEDELYRRAVLHYVRQAAARPDRTQALELYEAAGGTDPLVHAFDVRREEEERVEAFIASGGLRDPYAFGVFLERLEDNEQVDDLRRQTRNATGRFFVDPERSGSERVEVEFDNGSLVRMHFDDNNDGIRDLELRIDPQSGLPVEVALPTRDEVFEYRRYPEVESVRIENERYAVRPGLLRVRVFSSDSFFAQTPVSLSARFPEATEIDVPDIDTIVRTSYLREIESDGGVTTVDRLFNGQVLMRMEDTDGNGRTDVVTYYESGVAVRAIRDVLGDGYFEVLEEYRDGLLFMVGLDNTRDGIYDYIERYEDGVLREWDISADRRVDIREQSFSDSTRRAEFLRFLEAPAPRIDRLWSILPPVF